MTLRIHLMSDQANKRIMRFNKLSVSGGHDGNDRYHDVIEFRPLYGTELHATFQMPDNTWYN